MKGTTVPPHTAVLIEDLIDRPQGSCREDFAWLQAPARRQGRAPEPAKRPAPPAQAASPDPAPTEPSPRDDEAA